MLHRENRFEMQFEELQKQKEWDEYEAQDGKYFRIHSKYGMMSHEREGLTELSKGGILSDEMGLGKTVMMIALIHSDLDVIQ